MHVHINTLCLDCYFPFISVCLKLPFISLSSTLSYQYPYFSDQCCVMLWSKYLNTYIQKRNVINRGQLVVFSAFLIQPVALPTEPLFLLPWGISEVSDAATMFCHFFGMHCCCNIVAIIFSNSILDVFSITKWSNLKGNLHISNLLYFIILT